MQGPVSRRRGLLRVGDVVVTRVAIPVMRVPPGALIRVGTHGVIAQPTGPGKWLVRFDTGNVLEAQDDDLDRLAQRRPR
jgi:hypothetical protein